jgi:hypothetical protein
VDQTCFGRGKWPLATEFILSEKQNCEGKYIYPGHIYLTKFVSRSHCSTHESFGLWSQVFHGNVRILQVLKTVRRMRAARAGGPRRGSPRYTPTMQAVTRGWGWLGVGFCVTMFGESFNVYKGLYVGEFPLFIKKGK